MNITNAIAEARARLPLPALMEKLDLKAHAKRSAFCPFHENTETRAFSVFKTAQGRWRWKCHSKCGSGDEIAFVAALNRTSMGEAMIQYFALAGVDGRTDEAVHYSNQPPSPREKVASSSPRRPPYLPVLTIGSANDFTALAELRKVDAAALRIASDMGLLRFATLGGHRAWIITDDDRLNAQARRLDGGQWGHTGGKAWTLRGSWASTPIGLNLVPKVETVWLVEGGPDLLAAIHFIHRAGRVERCGAVGMLGAGQRIPATAIQTFAGKKVVIFGHADDAGQRAAAQWRSQLRAGGAEAVVKTFTGLRLHDGRPVKDLNDCTSVHPDDQPTLDILFHEH